MIYCLWIEVFFMFKDIKWSYVAIVSIVSLFLLFGGWYLYQNISIKNPINEAVSSIKGIKVTDLEINKKSVNLSINLYDIDNFQVTYELIEETISPFLNNRSLNIEIINDGNDELNLVWSKSYFYIAEAIDKKEYSLIPQAIDKMKQEYNLDQASYTMDETNIYIDLHQNDAALYFVIPRELKTEVSDLG